MRNEISQGGRPYLAPGRNWEAILAQADGTLGQDAKRRHPEISMIPLREQFSGQWVVFLPTKVDSDTGELSGRVFASSPDRQSLDRELESLRQTHPELPWSAFHANPQKPGNLIVA